MKKTSGLDIHKDTIFCGVYNGKKLNDEFSLKTIKNFRVERYTIFKLCES